MTAVQLPTEQSAPPLVISIQSQVVHGHVGNSAAVFPLQAAGLQVAAIPTVIFSNTPDYPTLRGAPLPPDFFADLLLGAKERGLPERASFILTGYIGSVEVAKLTAEFVAECKRINPAVTYLCDPVMGDHGPGLYVPEEIADVIRSDLLSMADITTPNTFELGYLTGQPVETHEDLLRAAKFLRLTQDASLVVTGAEVSDTPEGHLESVIIDPEGVSRLPAPKIPVALPGTGDLFAALILANLARGADLRQAVGTAQSLTGKALNHARTINAREVVLSEPEFRRFLLSM